MQSWRGTDWHCWRGTCRGVCTGTWRHCSLFTVEHICLGTDRQAGAAALATAGAGAACWYEIPPRGAPPVRAGCCWYEVPPRGAPPVRAGRWPPPPTAGLCPPNIPCSSKIITYRYSELTFSYSFFSVWTHKLRFLAKLLPIPKRAKNTQLMKVRRQCHVLYKKNSPCKKVFSFLQKKCSKIPLLLMLSILFHSYHASSYKKYVKKQYS